MGIIRKTLSISTLGIVPFRSKKELIRRAEKGEQQAKAELAREHTARAEADQRVAAAERRVREAELQALHEAKVADKARRGRRGRTAGKAGKADKRAPKAGGAREMLGDLMTAAQPVEDRAREAGRRGRVAAKKAAKRAQEEAEKAAKTARKEAKRGGALAREKLQEVEEAVAPRLEAAAEKAQDLADSAKERAAELSEKARERR